MNLKIITHTKKIFTKNHRRIKYLFNVKFGGKYEK